MSVIITTASWQTKRTWEPIRKAKWSFGKIALQLFLKVLANGESIADIALRDIDPRRWAPGETVQIEGKAKIPDSIKAGSVRFALWMPDQAPNLRTRSEYSIRFANREVWNEAQGFNLLGLSVPVR